LQYRIFSPFQTDSPILGGVSIFIRGERQENKKDSRIFQRFVNAPKKQRRFFYLHKKLSKTHKNPTTFLCRIKNGLSINTC
jgi:hypothetical protein